MESCPQGSERQAARFIWTWAVGEYGVWGKAGLGKGRGSRRGWGGGVVLSLHLGPRHSGPHRGQGTVLPQGLGARLKGLPESLCPGPVSPSSLPTPRHAVLTSPAFAPSKPTPLTSPAPPATRSLPDRPTNPLSLPTPPGRGRVDCLCPVCAGKPVCGACQRTG